MKLIAEIRAGDPINGKYDIEFDVAAKTQEFTELGANMISVQTAPSFFGDKSWLKTVRANTNLRVIRRDFISSTDDIKETVDHGFEFIILLMEMYTFEELEKLVFQAQQNGLIVMLDLSTMKALNMAPFIDTNYILVNNTNERTGHTNMLNTVNLGGRLPDSLAVITSGGYTEDGLPELQKFLSTSPFDYILLHDTLMKAKNIKALTECVKKL